MGIPVVLVESDAVIKTLFYIFGLCYIFVITFWNILNVYLVSCDLFFTVNGTETSTYFFSVFMLFSPTLPLPH